VLDMHYDEGQQAEVDMNVVMPGVRSPAARHLRRGPGHGRGDGLLPHGARQLLGLGRAGPHELTGMQAEVVEVAAGHAIVEATPVCASATRNKVAEIEAILSDVRELVPRPRPTFPTSSRTPKPGGQRALKAVAIAAASGDAASPTTPGLEVAALGGRAGGHTARYAGEGASYARTAPPAARSSTGRGPPGRFRTVAMVVADTAGRSPPRGVRRTIDTADGAGRASARAVFRPRRRRRATFAEMGPRSQAPHVPPRPAFRTLGPSSLDGADEPQ